MKIEDIKFKAKRLDNGEWIEGSLTYSQGTAFIHRKESDEDDRCYLTPYRVIPETICQFTGLKDEKGNEIWENDILLNVTNDSPNGTVIFKYGAFCLLAKNGRDFCVALKHLLTNKEWLTRFKVAGNKYDKKIVNY